MRLIKGFTMLCHLDRYRIQIPKCHIVTPTDVRWLRKSSGAFAFVGRFLLLFWTSKKVKDSGAILHCSAQTTLKAEYTIETLKQVFVQYQDWFPPEVSLMTDDGSENSSIKDWIALNGLDIQCRHVIAQSDVAFSNSMVEAANKSLKYSGLYLQLIPDLKTLQKILPDIHHDHLHRPLHDLDGRTPYEVLHDIPYPEKPENITVVTAQERRKQNKQLLCCKGFSF